MGGLCVGAVAAVLLFICCGNKNRQRETPPTENRQRETPPSQNRQLETPPTQNRQHETAPPNASTAGAPTQNRQRETPPPNASTASAPRSAGKRIFTFQEVKRFTKNFSSPLGVGGSANVYKGALPTGEEVAVKRLKKPSEQEFETEVENLSRAHHKHVVSLVGYCREEGHQILVYEFVPNNTLHFHLHDRESGQPTLDWEKRLNIALGSAKGLAYLHEGCHPKIIHRDIKATNILLNDKFEAKIADFGIAKCISEPETHVFTLVKGSYGYLDPKYSRSGQLTEKSDIYSFGVVLLELITGRKASDATDSPENRKGLADWVKPQLKRYLEDRNFDSFVDRRLRNNYKRDEMARMVQCAVACVYKHRPNMSEIVQVLGGCRCSLSVSSSDLNVEEKLTQTGLLSGSKSSDCGTSQGLEMSRKTPLAIPEHGSGHHNKPKSGSGRGDPSGPTTQGRDLRRK